MKDEESEIGKDNEVKGSSSRMIGMQNPERNGVPFAVEPIVPPRRDRRMWAG
jgi:hypothetical protein